jgi:hypothetical protein
MIAPKLLSANVPQKRPISAEILYLPASRGIMDEEKKYKKPM